MIQAKRNLSIRNYASTGGRIISVEINCREIRQDYQGQDSHYVNDYDGDYNIHGVMMKLKINT